MRRKKLSEIAGIQSGLVLSRKEAGRDVENPFTYTQLNLRSLDDGTINKDLLDQYSAKEELAAQFLTAENDIVISLFSPFRSTIIKGQFIGIVVPSQFAIIRITDVSVSPQFLYAYLSHGKTLEILAIRESGSILKGINISSLSELKIPILSLSEQEIIAACSEAHLIRKQLYRELIQQYDIQLNAAINRTIGRE